MKINKKKDQRVDASILLRRGYKVIMGARDREEPGRERGEREKKWGRIRYGMRQERSPEGQENE